VLHAKNLTVSFVLACVQPPSNQEGNKVGAKNKGSVQGGGKSAVRVVVGGSPGARTGRTKHTVLTNPRGMIRKRVYVREQ